MKIQIFFIIITALIFNQVLATLYNYDEIGAVSDDNSLDILINNQQILKIHTKIIGSHLLGELA